VRVSRRSDLRPIEALLLGLVLLLGLLGFLLAAAGLRLAGPIAQTGEMPAVRSLLVVPLLAGGLFVAAHALLVIRRRRVEQIILPVVALLFSLGIVLIWRLRGDEGAWQQVLRGFLPGMAALGALLAWPYQLTEFIRRQAIPISLAGLGLALLTGILGSADETGARLALVLGPLPPIQTSELIKLALIIFLAWYIDREGRRMEGRAILLFGRLRLPALRYALPGLLFVFVATLALVRMADFGAVLILGIIFVAMLYAGFDPRLFGTIAVIGLGMALVVALVLVFVWDVPAVIENRFLAFANPWSTAELMVNGVPTGLTISEGPGYQIQQAVYATISGGLSGAGLGFGSPEYIPLAASDFIFAALLEEMGAMIGFAVLALFGVLALRIFRVAMLLPGVQVFERLLVTGIGIHLFTQVFVMAGGTLNLIPLTGVTIPFLSLGGMALLTNLVEVGIVLALAQRLEAR